VTDLRFELLHARAIGWPRDRFDYIGIDDEGDTTEHYAGEVRHSPPFEDKHPDNLLTDTLAEIRLYPIPILSIRMSPTPVYQERIQKPLLPISSISRLLS
jgi:hypothetical protein